MFAVCVAIRLALYAALTSFTVFVLLGPAGYKGSFDALFGWLPFLPDGLAGALLLTAITQFIAAVFFSTIQVGLYRRALGAWPEPGLAGQRQIAAAPPTVERAGADPRAVLAAAAVVTAVLLFTHAGSCSAPSPCGSRGQRCWHDTATATWSRSGCCLRQRWPPGR